MKPVCLKLFNFLAYKNPDPLLFDGIELACLTGANGAGKSSLLDAITFALWGRARAKGFELVHSGENEMRVELDFEHDGTMYCVTRQLRGPASKPKSELNLLSIAADGSRNVLNGTNTTETQKKVDELLRLNYDLFVSSAYLQQGKADSFTVMLPSERKKLLANLLGIDRWVTYEERAKKARRALEDELLLIQGHLNSINAELASESEKRAQLVQKKQALTVAEAQLAATQVALEAVRNAEQMLRQADEQITQAQHTIDLRQRELGEAERKANVIRQTIVQYQTTLADETRIEDGYGQLADTQRQNETLNEALKQIRALETRQTTLQRDVATERSALERELASLTATLQALEQQASAHRPTALAALTDQIATLEALEAERKTLQDQAKAHNNKRGELTSNQATLKKAGDAHNLKIKRLNEITDALCPTCGQTLTEEGRARVIGDWNIELEELRDQFRSANQELLAISQFIKTQEERQETIGKDLSRLPYLHKEKGQLEEKQATASTARQKLEAQQMTLQTLTDRLTNEDFALDKRAELAQVNAQIEQIQYSSDSHHALEATLKELRAYEEAKRTLEDARKMLPRDQELLDNALERITRLTGERDAATEHLTALRESLPMLQGNLVQYRTLQTQLISDSQTYNEVRDQVIVLGQELNAIDRKKKEREALFVQQEAASLGVSRYRELIVAFGKNGVPAMIIEAAIPQLEDLANDLLTRMTSGRMHLRLKSQHNNNDGSLKETLDIEIADELGTRNYDLYSGGEAFRINFALRVALSKLLAQRAGAHVQTLFIDEGFGTQDEDGRIRLVEAINTVQHDFEMILVITHMDDLRDSFPVHILVEKTAQGSRFALQ